MPARLKIAIVAPTLRILGGQSVQAHRLVEIMERRSRNRRGTRSDQSAATNLPAARGRQVHPHCPDSTDVLADLAHQASSRRRRSHLLGGVPFFLLAPMPAVLIARLLEKPVVMNYRSGEAPDHLSDRESPASCCGASTPMSCRPPFFSKSLRASTSHLKSSRTSSTWTCLPFATADVRSPTGVHPQLRADVQRWLHSERIRDRAGPLSRRDLDAGGRRDPRPICFVRRSPPAAPERLLHRCHSRRRHVALLRRRGHLPPDS